MLVYWSGILGGIWEVVFGMNDELMDDELTDRFEDDECIHGSLASWMMIDLLPTFQPPVSMAIIKVGTLPYRREAHLTSLAAGAFDGAGEISAGAQMSGVGRSPG